MALIAIFISISATHHHLITISATSTTSNSDKCHYLKKTLSTIYIDKCHFVLDFTNYEVVVEEEEVVGLIIEVVVEEEGSHSAIISRLSISAIMALLIIHYGTYRYLKYR